MKTTKVRSFFRGLGGAAGSGPWLALVIAVVASFPRPALATAFIDRIDDLTDSNRFLVLVDGTLHLDNPIGTDGFNYSHTFLNWTLASAVDIEANIYEPGTGLLSDTFMVTAAAGGLPVAFTIAFRSDTDNGPALTALTNNPLSITENGDWQSIGTVTLENLVTNQFDTVEFQFRSDVVPEPSGLLLLSSGLSGLAAITWRRSRRKSLPGHAGGTPRERVRTVPPGAASDNKGNG
jgi:hypothetical protein